jgi:aspartate aminotransferase-like enzyme
MVHPRVLRAMAHPLLGHLDPQVIALMNQMQDLLRYVVQTENQMTLPVSGTGSASMESTVANLLEPGDSILIGVNGYFGERLCDMAGRHGAEVRRLERPWGEVLEPGEIDAALREALRLVHEEGLEACFARPRANSVLLWDGLADLGLELIAPTDHRLPTLTTVAVPDGVSVYLWKSVS